MLTTIPASLESDRLLKLNEVINRCALSRTAIYRKIKEGTFPKQVTISVKAVAWYESDINAWVAGHRQKQGQVRIVEVIRN